MRCRDGGDVDHDGDGDNMMRMVIMMMIQVGFPRPLTHPPVRPGKLPQARKRCRGDLSEVEVAGQRNLLTIID